MENSHLLIKAIAKIKEEIQPAEKGAATNFWTTTKFKEAILQITDYTFTNQEITTALEQDFFISQYIPEIGIVWLVKEVDQ